MKKYEWILKYDLEFVWLIIIILCVRVPTWLVNNGIYRLDKTILILVHERWLSETYLITNDFITKPFVFEKYKKRKNEHVGSYCSIDRNPVVCVRMITSTLLHLSIQLRSKLVYD